MSLYIITQTTRGGLFWLGSGSAQDRLLALQKGDKAVRLEREYDIPGKRHASDMALRIVAERITQEGAIEYPDGWTGVLRRVLASADEIAGYFLGDFEVHLTGRSWMLDMIKKTGLQPATIASICNCSRSQVWRWTNQDAHPDLIYLLRMATFVEASGLGNALNLRKTHDGKTPIRRGRDGH